MMIPLELQTWRGFGSPRIHPRRQLPA